MTTDSFTTAADLATDMPPTALLFVGIGMLVVVLVVMWLFVDVCDDPEDGQ